MASSSTLTTRRQWAAQRQATTQVVDEEGMVGFSSLSISEVYRGAESRRSKHRFSRTSMPPLAAVIDMASMEDSTDA